MINVIVALSVVLAMAIQAQPASAQERLRLAWAGFSPTNSPIWVIKTVNCCRNDPSRKHRGRESF